MKTTKILLSILIFTFSSLVSSGQNNTSINYIKVINNIDSLINYTFRAIRNDYEKSKSDRPSASAQVRNLNKENSEVLRNNFIPELEKSLIDQFGGDENINNQIHPYIVSLKECTATLEKLTTSQTYDKDEIKDYTSAFLFKELAKGNLFRSLSNVNADRKKFTVSISFGFLYNNLETQIQDNFIKSNWNSDEFYNANQGLRKSNFHICVDYAVSDKVVLGIEVNNIPATGAVTINTPDTIDKVEEVVNGSILGFKLQYVLKHIKPSGYGFEAKCGFGINYNQYKLITDFQVNHAFLYIDTFQNTIAVRELLLLNKTESLNSLGINFNANANYHFNKNISLQFGLKQYIDFGANVPSHSFYNRVVNEHTLNCNGFAIDVGLAAHF